jgi:hypothetical protein
MGTRWLAWVTAGIVWCAALPAHADPKAEIAAKARSAMMSYDAMDYDAARRQLNQALAIAKKAKLDRDPIVAKVYLGLGIALLAGSDQEAAKVAFLSAVQIDPRIAIDPAYKSAELVKLLDEARLAASDGSAEPVADTAECRSVRGLKHEPIDSGRIGAAQPIEAWVASELAPTRVVAMYRPDGAIDFSEARLTRQGGCRYAGGIPASAMRGGAVAYYIAAYDASNRVLAANGSSGSPHVLTIGGGRGASDDPEDPEITGDGGGRGRRSGGGTGAQVSAVVAPASDGPKFVLSVAGGTSVGYVTGFTEGGNKVQSCCIGASLVVITPELAYRTSPTLSVGIATRLGLPIGANVMGHRSIAPSVLLRVRRVFSASGDGLRVMAEIGGGFLRNTIKLDIDQPGMDTDIVAQGPLLLGVGIGYTKRLVGSLALFADLDAMAGIAVVGKFGTATRLNTGISGDFSLGFAVGF